MALSFAKAGVKGVVLVDVLDDATLAAAAKDVQSYGATVRQYGLRYTISH